MLAADHGDGESMKRLALLIIASFLLTTAAQVPTRGAGITPEQIFQPQINMDHLLGTWEVLPEESPLGEQAEKNSKPFSRTLMTLRKDGTCRVFNVDNPAGSDGMWTLTGHQMHISFSESPSLEYFIYGVKGDFMVTRTPIKDGRDQLWSRVK